MWLFELFSNLMAQNQVFGGGCGLAGLGMAGMAAKRLANLGGVAAKRRYQLQLEVTSRDKSYQWVLLWVTRTATSTQHLSVETRYSQTDSGRVHTTFELVPSPGTHFFWYQNKILTVERTREKQLIDLQRSIPFETVVLTTWGRDKSLFIDILEEARKEALLLTEGFTLTYVAVGGHEWRSIGEPRTIRPLSSVVLSAGVSESLVSDVREFLESSRWYLDRGIPYRRGYLLYGPPGCGKTSFVTALAGAINYSICTLNVGDPSMTDDRLAHLLTAAPRDSLILLEDIDAAGVYRPSNNATDELRYQGLTRLTFSGLLNALDGVTSSDGRLLFMTTNFVERLDPAIIRPGRVDVRQSIGFASPEVVVAMFANFYPTAHPELPLRFAAAVVGPGTGLSAAQLQSHLLNYKDDPEGAVTNAANVHKQTS